LRRRYALAHGYAHALFDRQRVVEVAKPAHASELVANRANGFASAFLLPTDGVRDALEAVGKGRPSRRARTAFDVATQRTVRGEERAAPGSQAITVLDVVMVGRQFGTPYEAVVSRLVSLGYLSELEGTRFLGRRWQTVARDLAALFPSALGDRTPQTAPVSAPDLVARVVHLAVEGHRQGAIDKSSLGQIAAELQLPALSAAKLQALADAVR